MKSRRGLRSVNVQAFRLCREARPRRLDFDQVRQEMKAMLADGRLDRDEMATVTVEEFERRGRAGGPTW